MNTPKSRFSIASAKATSCGQKSNKDVRPELTAERAANRITLNAKASDLLGCKGGDYIKIFKNSAAEATEDMFAIAIVGTDVPGAARLAQTGATENASVGRPCSCSYSGIWSYMIQNDVNAEALSISALQELGMAELYVTMKKLDGSETSTVLAKRNVSYGFELIDENVEIDGIVVEKLYALVDVQVEELEAPSIAQEKEKKADMSDAPVQTESKGKGSRKDRETL